MGHTLGGGGGRATGVRVRLIEHSTETPFESGNDRVGEQNDGGDEDDDVDDDAMAENSSKVIFDLGSSLRSRFAFARGFSYSNAQASLAKQRISLGGR